MSDLNCAKGTGVAKSATVCSEGAAQQLAEARMVRWVGVDMWVLSESLNGMCPLPERPMPRRISANRALFLESSGSVSAARASSYRVISQMSTPSGLVTLVTGWGAAQLLVEPVRVREEVGVSAIGWSS
jgi:hypothetical protein